LITEVLCGQGRLFIAQKPDNPQSDLIHRFHPLKHTPDCLLDPNLKKQNYHSSIPGVLGHLMGKLLTRLIWVDLAGDGSTELTR